jgi:tetratricopeptide (TPR) repeat protein
MTTSVQRSLSIALIMLSLCSNVYAANRILPPESTEDENEVQTPSPVLPSNSPAAESDAVKALCSRAFTLSSQNQFNQAKTTLDKALAMEPQSASVRRAYAYLYLSSNQPKLALSVIGSLAQSSKLTSADKILEGYAYWREKELLRAELAFRQAVELNNTDPFAATLYIRCLMANLKWSLAIAECQKALQRFRTIENQKQFLLLKAQSVEAKENAGTADDSFSAPPEPQILSPLLRRSKGG